MRLTVNRDAAARIRIGADEIERVVAAAVGPEAIEPFDDEGLHGVIIRFGPEVRATAEAIRSIAVSGHSGVSVPLGQIAHIEAVDVRNPVCVHGRCRPPDWT